MILDVSNFTNTKINKILDEHPRWRESGKYPYVKETTPDEVRAFFGLMYIRAVLRQNFLSVKRVYQHQYSNPLFKVTMSQNRFEFLISILQFDQVENRAERWENDRFTAFRSFFNKFNEHCSMLRIPSDFLSLDETLYPFRGRRSMKQYNPNKPAKYGLLYRSISDARLPYTYITLPYAGKPNNIIPESEYVTGTDNYTKYLVKGLRRSVDIRGRNISMGCFFTSMEVSRWLQEKGLTVVGTLKSNRQGIPEAIKSVTERDDLSVKYAYCDDIKSLLVSYVVKKKRGWKNVLVLSSMHRSVSITKDACGKPDVIVFYDHTKSGVDVMDQIAGCFSTRFKSHRWTMNVLSYVLDTVRTNMNTLWNEIHPEKKEKMSSYDFLWELGQSLIKPHIEYRYQNRVGIQTTIVKAMKEFLGINDTDMVPQVRTPDRKRCHFCLQVIQGAGSKDKKNKLAKVKWQCQEANCGKSVCQNHFIVYCNPCHEAIKNRQ